MYITKSDYTNYLKCKSLFYMNKFHKDLAAPLSPGTINAANNGIEVGKIAQTYFINGVLINREKLTLSEAHDETKKEINKGTPYIYEASFMFNDLFCAVDILKVNQDKSLDIYEVKSNKDVQDIYIDDVSFQYFVLTSLGYKVNHCYIMHLNAKYVYHDKFDIKSYFLIEEVTPKSDVSLNIDEIRKTTTEPIVIGCKNCKDCSYKDQCYKHLPRPRSVFDIRNMHSFELYNKGYRSFEDVLNNPKCLKDKKGKLTKNGTKALEQIEFELFDKPTKINKTEIKKFLGNLKYPIYYLDFETVNDIVPFINGTKINYQRIIQYSLHIERKPNTPVEEIEKHDWRKYLQDKYEDNLKEVADQLVQDCEDNDGTILVYHQSTEKNLIEKLADLVPSQHDNLMALTIRIKDLLKPFVDRDYYDKNLKGSSSIKQVLPTLCPEHKDDYKNLPMVHKGDAIAENYKELISNSGKEHEDLIKALHAYCRQDTRSEIYIIHKLYELVK